MARRKKGEEMTLTYKEERFCQELFSLGVKGFGNASRAYRIAYDTSGMNLETIHVAACNLKNNYKVTIRLEQLQNEAAARYMQDSDRRERNMRVLDAIIDADLSDAYKETEDGILVERHPCEYPERLRLAVRRVNKGMVDLNDKIAAIKEQNAMNGWSSKDVRVTGSIATLGDIVLSSDGTE